MLLATNKVILGHRDLLLELDGMSIHLDCAAFLELQLDEAVELFLVAGHAVLSDALSASCGAG